MWKYLIFCWMLNSLCQAAIAQQTAIDSLLTMLRGHPQQDTVRLNILNEIVYAYHNIDPAKGIAMADEAITLAKKINNPVRLAGSYSNKGVNYWAKGDDSLAMLMYQTALDLHRKENNLPGVARMYNNIGLLHFNQSDYYQAISFHENALHILQQLKDTSRIAAALNNIGVDYQYISDYPKALGYFLEALAIYEKTGDAQAYGTGLANTHANIGIIYKNLGQYTNALQYQQKALAIYEQLENKQGIANTYGNIGVLYDKMLQTQNAIDYFMKALAINRKLGNQRKIASDLTNAGVIYIQTKEYEKAFGLLEQSLRIYEQSGDRNNTSLVLNQLGEVYLYAPDIFYTRKQKPASQRYSIAIDYKTRALKIAKEIGSLDRQSEVLKSLSELYEQKNDPTRALAAFKEHIAVRDSVMNDEKRTAITRRESAFEFEKKEAVLKATHEKETALANAEIKRARIIKNAVTAGILIVLAASSVGYLLYKRRRDADEKRKEAEYRSQVADTEMKALRAQMNPHFIFNSLNSIADYISKNDLPSADTYLTKFAKLMRLILEHSEQKMVPLEDDLRALELYMQLEAKRLNGKFTYTISVDESVDASAALVPPLILQPFVENSIWHGIAKKEGRGTINIFIKMQNNELCCTIEDDGAGRVKEDTTGDHSLVKNKSLGMKITGERIDILNKENNSNGGIVLTDLEQGLRAEICLPLEKI
ncbi:MAG: tetratricopeptide repeat protein [Chitinophagaceae bacterium]|nr:tetratricopeptide repeat protein [Chitinophagaceae bacterium]